MKILFIGDVVGAPGRRILKSMVARVRHEGTVHAIIVNGENAAAGNGITSTLADEMFDYGIDAMTLGDHVWDQKEVGSYLDKERRIVRPLNLPRGCPGRGWTSVPTEFGPLHIVSLLGRVFMDYPYESPFAAMDDLLAGPLPRNGITLVDFHAEATSEKICMGWYLDGRVSAVVGTHTHVQTSDARILPQGTAYITDLGMTGPRDSVIGRDVVPVTQRFTTSIPARFEVAGGPAVIEGALITLNRTTGKATSIASFREIEER